LIEQALKNPLVPSVDEREGDEIKRHIDEARKLATLAIHRSLSEGANSTMRSDTIKRDFTDLQSKLKMYVICRIREKIETHFFDYS
jgi:hypothetical protein